MRTVMPLEIKLLSGINRKLRIYFDNLRFTTELLSIYPSNPLFCSDELQIGVISDPLEKYTSID